MINIDPFDPRFSSVEHLADGTRVVTVNAQEAKRAAGIPQAIESETCSMCGRSVPLEVRAQWDMDSQREYELSGTCKSCQRIIYDEPIECTCDRPCCEVDVGIGIIDCGWQHCPVHGNEECREVNT